MKIDVFVKECFLVSCLLSQAVSRNLYSWITFGVNSVCTILKKFVYDYRWCLACISQSLIVLIDNIADFSGIKISFPTVDIADDFSVFL